MMIYSVSLVIGHLRVKKRKYAINSKYTMHNKFSNILCFASFCAHLCAISNNFNCNDENSILGR